MEKISSNMEIMMKNNIEPKEVFSFFEQICAIPHGSGNVKAISDYCVAFAKQRGLKVSQDEKQNVIIWKDGAPGYESLEPIILQGHMDMVCVKEPDCPKNLEVEPIELKIDGDYIYADQTSLGGDDGIAIAYALALLDSKTIPHPPLEAIFTVDEEVGMLGAAYIDLSEIQGHKMLNIDSEEEGYFLAGCAGGATVYCNIPITKTSVKGIGVHLSIQGLAGGHSGTEIIWQRANANKLMGRLFHTLRNHMGVTIAKISGGEKDNAIAKIAQMDMVLHEDDISEFKEVIDHCIADIKHEYSATDPALNISYQIDQSVSAYDAFNAASATRVEMALLHVQNGIIKMSNDIKGLVQTSLNLGVVTENEDTLQLCFSVRSAVGSEKDALIDQLESLTELLGGECTIMGKYPAWEYRKDSPLRDLCVKVYQEMYGKEPVVQTLHAGVECGLISEKIPDLDCISFGPDILDIHTTKERMSISSVKRTWEYLIRILSELKQLS
jgi:dipeptidase D